MDVPLVVNLGTDSSVLPFSFGYLLGELSERGVEGVRWTEVWGVDKVVASFRVLDQPRRVKRGVVPHNVDDTQDAPILLHGLDDVADLDVVGVDFELLADSLTICERSRPFGVRQA